MATVIERDQPVERSSYIERDNGAGWAVAAVVIIAILAVGAFVWARYYSAPAATQAAPGSNINVTLPGGSGAGSTQGSGSTGGTGASSGSSGGASSQTSGSASTHVTPTTP